MRKIKLLLAALAVLCFGLGLLLDGAVRGALWLIAAALVLAVAFLGAEDGV